jgi:hypothetical protein
LPEDWVVYAKPPFGGAEHVLQYLARYAHRVAISGNAVLRSQLQVKADYSSGTDDPTGLTDY